MSASGTVLFCMSTSPDNLQLLICQARQGDKAAFSQAVAWLEDDLHRLAQRKLAGPRLHNRVSSVDVVQQTLAAAWQSIDTLKYEAPGVFRAWLMSIHHKTISKQIRFLLAARRDLRHELPLQLRGSSSSGHEPLPLPAREPSPSNAARARELRERLFASLAKLPNAQQNVVCLRYLEELTYKEIIDRTGLTPGAVQGLLRRGLSSLLEQSGQDLKGFLSGLTSEEQGNEGPRDV